MAVDFRGHPMFQQTGFNAPTRFVVGGELDPRDFVPDTEKLIAGRKMAGKPTVSLHLPSHSHISEAYAVGTADESLSGPILKFIEAPPR